jgi:hypothetical protein
MNSKISFFSVFLLACTAMGCTSFRTTSLYRFANDSLAPQRTNKKLKGLPVKLKVPSHVSVVVYEQQVILGTKPEELAILNRAVKNAYIKVEDKKVKLRALDDAVDSQQLVIETAQRKIDFAKDSQKLHQTGSNDWSAYEAQIKKNLAIRASAEGKLQDAQDKRTAEKPALDADLNIASAELDFARLSETPGYALVSFSPPQYQVETQLEYTDKIFLVDFKRPAAGILDIKNAKMDDQQYFSQVQAEIEEKTIESISGALNTIKDPLVLLKPKKLNSAKPTSANTPEGESKDDVHFQKSVVAIQRFDISEPGWEEQMMFFVNEKLGVSLGVPLELQEVVGQISQR